MTIATLDGFTECLRTRGAARTPPHKHGGMPIEIAQQNLGHASLVTATVYITTEKRRRMKAVMAFSKGLARHNAKHSAQNAEAGCMQMPITAYFPANCSVNLLSSAGILPGDKTKSTHPVACALTGMPLTSAEVSCAKVVPPKALITLHPSAPSPS